MSQQLSPVENVLTNANDDLWRRQANSVLWRLKLLIKGHHLWLQCQDGWEAAGRGMGVLKKGLFQEPQDWEGKSNRTFCGWGMVCESLAVLCQESQCSPSERWHPQSDGTTSATAVLETWGHFVSGRHLWVLAFSHELYQTLRLEKPLTPWSQTNSLICGDDLMNQSQNS